MESSLTTGNETKVILKFALPLIIGNVFQQLYNVADTIIVGRFLGSGPLAAVGSAFALMTFLNSIIIGLCMGASILFSQHYGAKDEKGFLEAVYVAFVFILSITLVINVLGILFIDNILGFLNTPVDIYDHAKDYILVILYGLLGVFFYNFFASVLRSIGNSTAALVFLMVAAIVNTVLDLVFIGIFNSGVAGAAWATIIGQTLSAVLCGIYCIAKMPNLVKKYRHIKITSQTVKKVASYSVLTSAQQSIMNLGILLVQGIVNSFGVPTVAAYTAATKIEAFAYIPLQQYGDAFSTYVAQNFGAKRIDRIKKGVKSSTISISIFSIILSALVVGFAPYLIQIFIKKSEIEIINIGVSYLRTTGSFYILIGFLFSFYGYFRGIGHSKKSISLTIISLGLRVALAYAFSGMFGSVGIWWSIPIGWFIADVVGTIMLKTTKIEVI